MHRRYYTAHVDELISVVALARLLNSLNVVVDIQCQHAQLSHALDHGIGVGALEDGAPVELGSTLEQRVDSRRRSQRLCGAEKAKNGGDDLELHLERV